MLHPRSSPLPSASGISSQPFWPAACIARRGLAVPESASRLPACRPACVFSRHPWRLGTYPLLERLPPHLPDRGFDEMLDPKPLPSKLLADLARSRPPAASKPEIQLNRQPLPRRQAAKQQRYQFPALKITLYKRTIANRFTFR